MRRARITNFLHKGDLPSDVVFKGDIAVDTEAMGLNNKRDRLCLVQLSDGNGDAHLVQFAVGVYKAPNLTKLLTDSLRVKIFHFARFDLSIMRQYLGVRTAPVYCTKIASKLVRTFTDRHGLKDLCRELVGVDLSKQQQTSDWGAAELTAEQLTYAASDVLHLHALWAKLEGLLRREGRLELAEACFAFLPTRGELDVLGWDAPDIFSH